MEDVELKEPHSSKKMNNYFNKIIINKREYLQNIEAN